MNLAMLISLLVDLFQTWSSSLALLTHFALRCVIRPTLVSEMAGMIQPLLLLYWGGWG